uniref:Uncharacterized protein n=1 Tax=viral metagenome TaxID=1070528 RepID=A0A6H1ZJI6_9ZZZZ
MQITRSFSRDSRLRCSTHTLVREKRWWKAHIHRTNRRAARVAIRCDQEPQDRLLTGWVIS